MLTCIATLDDDMAPYQQPLPRWSMVNPLIILSNLSKDFLLTHTWTTMAFRKLTFRIIRECHLKYTA